MNMLGMEIWSYVEIPIIWWLFKRFAKRNVFGDMVAGTMIGCFNEFATEPLWNYHYRFTIYKDIPPAVIMGWGVMFTLVVFLSEKLYFWVLKTDKIMPYDKRIFLFDVAAGVAIGLPMETLGLKSHVWDYNYDILKWSGLQVPFFNMPVEALVGYILIMLIGPTFVRYWQGAFEGQRPQA